MDNAHLDFGYPWWLSYGHLVAATAVAVLLLGYSPKWSRWPMLGLEYGLEAGPIGDAAHR